MVVACAIRRTASCLKSTLYFLDFFFIGLPHYGRQVSPTFQPPPCLTLGVHYTSCPLKASLKAPSPQGPCPLKASVPSRPLSPQGPLKALKCQVRLST